MKRVLAAILAAVLYSGTVLGACPPADVTGDCRVDLADFAEMAEQWMTEGIPTPILNGMTWVSINDPGVDRDGDGYPEGFRGLMSKYEITNAQYCEFLNAALASGDIIVRDDGVVCGSSGSNSGEDFLDQPYYGNWNWETSPVTDGQITYSEGIFSVLSRDGYSMANHPVDVVTWYGATAFCNYYGYRLPTLWEWQAVADYDGSYIYGCGTTINSSMANFQYANPLGLTNQPFTSPVGYYPAYGYGLCDMAGNIREWTSSRIFNSWFDSVSIVGGGWESNEYDSSFAICWHNTGSAARLNFLGFRPCR